MDEAARAVPEASTGTTVTAAFMKPLTDGVNAVLGKGDTVDRVIDVVGDWVPLDKLKSSLTTTLQPQYRRACEAAAPQLEAFGGVAGGHVVEFMNVRPCSTAGSCAFVKRLSESAIAHGAMKAGCVRGVGVSRAVGDPVVCALLSESDSAVLCALCCFPPPPPLHQHSPAPVQCTHCWAGVPSKPYGGMQSGTLDSISLNTSNSLWPGQGCWWCCMQRAAPRRVAARLHITLYA